MHKNFFVVVDQLHEDVLVPSRTCNASCHPNQESECDLLFDLLSSDNPDEINTITSLNWFYLAKTIHIKAVDHLQMFTHICAKTFH